MSVPDILFVWVSPYTHTHTHVGVGGVIKIWFTVGK